MLFGRKAKNYIVLGEKVGLSSGYTRSIRSTQRRNRSRSLLLPPDETPESGKRDFIGAEAPERLNAPAEIGAAPRGQPVAPGRLPQKPEHYLELTCALVVFPGLSGVA